MKTKQAAMQAARKKLGAAANEGVDFTCSNTGAGWAWTEIRAANEPAAKAKAKRAPKENPTWTKGDFARATGPESMSAAELAAFPKTKAKLEAQKTAAKALRAPKVTKTPPTPPKPADAPKPAPAAGTKGAALMAMLRQPGGASSKEMEQATGWKAASVRGYLGTLRKQGVAVESKKLPGEAVIYKIHEAKADPGDVV